MKPVSLAPGEEQTVSLRIDPRQMAVVTEAGEYVIEPGCFEVKIADTQPDARSLALGGSKPAVAAFDVTGTVTLPF
jgi:hypothetical protein